MNLDEMKSSWSHNLDLELWFQPRCKRTWKWDTAAFSTGFLIFARYPIFFVLRLSVLRGHTHTTFCAKNALFFSRKNCTYTCRRLRYEVFHAVDSTTPPTSSPPHSSSFSEVSHMALLGIVTCLHGCLDAWLPRNETRRAIFQHMVGSVQIARRSEREREG